VSDIGWMKEIRITLEDKEYYKARVLKGEKTWKEFFMNGCGEEHGSNNNNKK